MHWQLECPHAGSAGQHLLSLRSRCLTPQTLSLSSSPCGTLCGLWNHTYNQCADALIAVLQAVLGSTYSASTAAPPPPAIAGGSIESDGGASSLAVMTTNNQACTPLVRKAGCSHAWQDCWSHLCQALQEHDNLPTMYPPA